MLDATFKKTVPPGPILSQISLVYKESSYLSTILFNIIPVFVSCLGYKYIHYIVKHNSISDFY